MGNRASIGSAAASGPGGLPFLTVVIPTHDRREDLLVTLRTLVAQDYPDDRYEVVVAADACTDGTAEAVAAAAAASPVPIRMVVPERRGASAARNAGVRVAAGDPICFVDDDVEAPLGWLREMAAGFRRHPEAECFGGPIRMRVEGAAPYTCMDHPYASELDHGRHDRPAEWVWGANMAVRRSAFDRIGGFHEWIVIGDEESEWQNRLHRATGTVMYLARAVMWHRRRAEDLAPGRLFRARFRRGFSSRRGAIMLERRVGVVRATGWGLLLVLHWRLNGCLGGLWLGGWLLGGVWATIRHPLERDPPPELIPRFAPRTGAAEPRQ